MAQTHQYINASIHTDTRPRAHTHTTHTYIHTDTHTLSKRYRSVLVKISVIVIKQERSQLSVTAHHWGMMSGQEPKQDQDLGGGYWKGCQGTVLLTDFLLLTCSVVSSYTQDHMPKGGSTHSGLDPLTSIIHKENAPQFAYAGQWRLSWFRVLHRRHYIVSPGIKLVSTDCIYIQRERERVRESQTQRQT